MSANPSRVDTDHRVPDAGPGQRREHGVAPRAGEEAAGDEHAEHRIHPVTGPGRGDRGGGVPDVLHDLVAEADHPPVHESVHDAVDLCRRDQGDDHHAEELEGLLDGRAGEGRPPRAGEPGRDQLRDQVVGGPVSGYGGGRHDQSAPGERGGQQYWRLPLQVVEVHQERHERHRVQPEQDDRGRGGTRVTDQRRGHHRGHLYGADQQ
jgi:hypothetical protein